MRSKRRRAVSLSLEGRCSTRECFVRACACCDRPTPRMRALHQRKASLLRRVAVVRRAGCRLQLQVGCRVSSKRRRACAHCLWEGGAASKISLRGRLAARVALGSGHTEERCTGERRLSFGARPWCDGSASASNAKPTAAFQASAGAPALIVSGEEAQQVSFLCAGAGPRGLWSAQAVRKSAELAKGSSPSARGYGAIGQRLSPTPSRLPGAKEAKTRLRSMSLGRRRSK